MKNINTKLAADVATVATRRNPLDPTLEQDLVAQQEAIIQQNRDVMRMAEKVILSATAFASQADILEAKECISALDAALKGVELSPTDKIKLAEAISNPPEPSEKLIAALKGGE